MKKVKSKFSLLVIAGITIAALTVGSCSKSSSGGGTTPPPLIGGYVSSDSVATDALIAYWPFDGDANDHKGGLTATVSGTITYPSTGVRGMSYQGAVGAYATLVPPASFPTSLTSYTISFWYNLPSNVDTNTTQGVFFYNGATQQGELINEFESPANKNLTGDSLRIHPGFWDIGDAPNYALFVPETFDTGAIGKWVFFTVSYNGGTSTYTTYQNAVPTGANTAFTNGMYVTPNPMWTDGTATTPLGNLKFTDAPQSIVIGTWPDGLFGQKAATANYLGQLDELRVFDRALTQQEVSGLYLNGQAGR
jgi:Concanavalin A-like lectin/glucanases superfamily